MSKEFHEHISRLAINRGLSGETPEQQLQALQRHATASFPNMVGRPSQRVARFRLIPVAKAGEQNILEARIPVSANRVAIAAVTEDRQRGQNTVSAVEELSDGIRSDLSKMIAAQLMVSEFIKVWIEGNEIIATITVVAPTPDIPETKT